MQAKLARRAGHAAPRRPETEMSETRRAGYWFCLALVLFGLLVLLRDNPLGRGLSAEDANWLRGGRFGYESRQTATLVYRRVALPLFADRLVGYKLPNALFHLANALLIYALFGRLLGRRLLRRNRSFIKTASSIISPAVRSSLFGR